MTALRSVAANDAHYPIAANAALYAPAQVEEYLSILFRNVEWNNGEVISLLGIGEKGTDREGVFKERQIIPPAFIGVAHGHLKRWAAWHAAGFIVPAVLYRTAQDKGDVTLDKVAALTAILLDIDSGDTAAKRAFVTERLGPPSMVVASGGSTDEGTPKLHLYWLLDEPSEAVERVAAVRKTLALKCGGDPSFGRATQVVRIPGSVHAKNGKAALCSILERSDAEYSFDDLAETIEAMQPMPGLPEPIQHQLPALMSGAMMDFAPKLDTAIAALHRDVNEGGTELTRWSEFSKVAGFNISEARAGRLTPEAAYTAANGWMLEHMNPPWPQPRFDQEFKGLVNKDIANHGPFPAPPAPWSNVAIGADLPLIHFADITACLANAWLVRNLLPVAGLALIYGAPGTGKSFFALDMALRIASGWSIDGRAVKQSPVIYIAAEGARGLRGRVEAFRRHHGVTGDLPFALIPCAVNLLDPTADLQRLIGRIEQELPRLGSPPGLIVVDTLAATFGGGDENTNAMVAYVNNLARMRDTFDATVMPVHHRPKDQLNNTPRGHSSLMGAMDTILLVDGAAVRLVTVTKQKDAEAGTPIAFALTSVPLGEDDEGEPVLSAVVDYRTIPQSKPLTAMAAAALQSLNDAIDEAAGAPVLEGAWRAKWNEGLPVDMQDEARRKAWGRARAALIRSGRVASEAGLWSIAPPTILPPSVMDFSLGPSAAR